PACPCLPLPQPYAILARASTAPARPGEHPLRPCTNPVSPRPSRARALRSSRPLPAPPGHLRDCGSPCHPLTNPAALRPARPAAGSLPEAAAGCVRARAPAPPRTSPPKPLDRPCASSTGAPSEPCATLRSATHEPFQPHAPCPCPGPCRSPPGECYRSHRGGAREPGEDPCGQPRTSPAESQASQPALSQICARATGTPPLPRGYPRTSPTRRPRRLVRGPAQAAPRHPCAPSAPPHYPGTSPGSPRPAPPQPQPPTPPPPRASGCGVSGPRTTWRGP
ncbi:hypothetical protein GA0115246_111217, partial [Streptomyces sp. SolWspMP-sol7th]